MSAPIFDELVGQEEVVGLLDAAVTAGQAVLAGLGGDTSSMTHSWLFTGPPGSGRSVAARALAAALQCPKGGCDACGACHTARGGTHADVRFVVPDGLSIGVGEMRSLVTRAQSAPTQGRWQILLIEDADRLTEAAGNALLKSIEEPPSRTVFLLCAPSVDDVLVTIRSRCRVVALRQPPASAIARLLVERDGIDPEVADTMASVAQGHVGRARRLARDSEARARRAAVLGVPRQLTGVGACFDAADALITAAETEAEASTTELAGREKADLETALGKGGSGKGASKAARGTAGLVKDLEKRQKSRLTRAQRDALDRALVDLAAFYRDVLVTRFGARVPLVHTDLAAASRAASGAFSAESVVRRIDAILRCREAIDKNVRPRIAVETLMLHLWRG
ncbi:DNA polymerase III subunit delta' [Phytomonospora sp. NPDC050363]|uniref:DNA polymerase III subunit delta' n=1 Tax=Phytomonospora sp. NPDC050363 TaxID=3155642 RepID=UPI0033EB93FC